MARAGICLLVAVCSVTAFNSPQVHPAEPESNPWETTIRDFEQWDSKNSFVADAVLFVGSSSIRMWATRNCFADLPVINRGFGGSRISDVNHFASRIVLPYRPAAIVFYAGDNDIAAGKTPHAVFDDYRKFVGLVHADLPKTPIIFISIKPSLSRWSLWPAMSTANRLIRDFCKADSRLYFVDVANCLLASDGKPNSTLFLADNLHLNADGYRAWTEILRPVIREALKSARSEPAVRQDVSKSGF